MRNYGPLKYTEWKAPCHPIVRQGTIISHWGHLGWGRFLYSKMTTVSRTYRCRKCTNISVLVAARPGHPSNGQLRRPPLAGKAMWYVRGSSPVAKVFQLRLYSADCLCCVILCPTKDPGAISSPNFLHCTRPFYRSRSEGPYPVIRRLYTASKWVPITWNGRKTIQTVFPKLVRTTTLSNRPTRLLNTPWSHRGSGDATIPWSA